MQLASLNTNDADIANNGVKLYRTNTTTFSTSYQIGTSQSFSGGTATFSSLSYDLPTGQNYIWVSYDIAGGATIGNIADAKIAANGIDIAGTTYPISDENPTGSRTIGDVKALASVTVTQASTATALKGSLNNETLLLDFNVTGYTGLLPLNIVAVTYTGTSSTDISASGVKLYRTNTNIFSTANPLGSAVSLSSGIASFSSLAYDLPNGHTYVWVCFDVASAATLNNKVDAKIAINGINVNGSTYNSVAEDPTGNRNIFYATYPLPFSETFSGSSSSLPTDWSYLTTAFSQGTGTTYHGNNSTYGIYKNIYSSSTTANAITPLMGPVSANTQLDFDYRIVDYTSYPATPTTIANLGTGTIKAEVSTDGTTFTPVLTIDNTNHIVSTSFTTKSVNLSAYSGQNVYIRFRATWGTSGDYYVDIDNVNVYNAANMTYTSSTSTQTNTTSVNAGTTNQQVIGMQVVTSGNLTTIYATKFTINSSGTTNLSDISNAKIYYTGTSSTFATTTQFGSTVAAPSATNFDVTGTQTLAQGTNYFWLTFDVNSTAVNGNVIDGQFTSITVGGSDYTPTITAPTGTRTIVNKTLTSVTGTQASTSFILKADINKEVLRLDFVAAGPSTGILSLNNINVTYTGSSSTDIPLNGVKLYRTTTTTFSTAYPLGTAQSLSAGVASFSGLNYDLAIGTTYIWVVFDIDANATTNNIVDAKIAINGINVGGNTYNASDIDPVGSRIIKAPLNGDYLVGASQTIPNYTTLTQAISDLNSFGVNGAVRFLLTDATYSSSETFPIIINAVNGASASNTVTIKPNTGMSSTISGLVSVGALIKLNGADYIIIDGSNNGTTSKDLTINNTSTATSGNGVIWIASASASDGATNNTIKNCIISGNAATTTQFGIYAGGTSSLSTSGNALMQNNNTIIMNNQVSKVQYGIFFIGVSSTSLTSGVQINNNMIGTATTGDGFSAFGIFASLLSSGTINGNAVQNNQNSSSFGFAPVGSTIFNSGIYLQNSQNSTISKNSVSNMNISGSSVIRVFAISSENPLFNTIGSPSANIISNNLVYNTKYTGSGSSSWQLSGINANGGYGDMFCFNSVYLSGTLGGSTSGPTAAFSNGNASTTTATANIIVKNNIFYINGNNTVGTYYAHYSRLATTIGSNFNYNDLSSTVTGGATANLGYYNSTVYLTLATWKTATSQDTNSYSVNPNYTSSSNLQPTATNYLIGTSISGITTDYSGATRSNPPDIGAYEGSESGRWLGSTSTDWATPSNWDNNLQPTASDNIVVNSWSINQPHITLAPTNSAVCNNLTINSGAVLTIDAGKALTVNGVLTNNSTNSGLIIKSDTIATGSLINNTFNVPATTERYIPAANWTANDEGWHLLSSPVVNQSISGNFTPTGTGNEYDFFAWDEATYTWLNQKIPANNITSFGSGMGYLVAYQQADTKYFTGNLNSNNVTLSLSYLNTSTLKGFNLLGNPYPCALDWQNGAWLKTNIESSAKVWDAIGKNYIDVSLIPTPNTNIIPANQGFFVRATAAGAGITIPSDAKVHSGQGFYKSTNDILVMKVSKNNSPVYDIAAISFNSQSTNLYNPLFDASEMQTFGDAPSFYSLLSTGEKLSINAIPTPTTNTIVNMGFVAGTNATYTFKATNLANISFTHPIILEDTKTGVSQNLFQNPTYQFTATTSDNANRFKLHFNASTGIQENENNATLVYCTDGQIIVSSKSMIKTIEIYNEVGQQMGVYKVNGNEFQIKANGKIQIIRIQTTDSITIRKLVVF